MDHPGVLNSILKPPALECISICPAPWMCTQTYFLMPMWTAVYINILSKVKHICNSVHTVHLQSYTYPMSLVLIYYFDNYFKAFLSQSCSTPISIILPLKSILKIFFFFLEKQKKKVGRDHHKYN